MTNTTNQVQEVLVVSQGFEEGDKGKISDFKMDDFRDGKLPQFSELRNSELSPFCRIRKYDPGSRCLQGYSRWITGENGKLRLLDKYWDSSG